MKVGDYVRTNDGLIRKIEKIKRNEITTDISFNDYSSNLINRRYLEDIIIKSSPNIIDLIEVGDIITFKDDEDVYKVIGRPDKECALEVFYLAKKYDGNTEDIMVYPDEMKKYIKSIVTKEQFESMEYKIGE